VTQAEIIIVGGGISGTAAAYHLARQGRRVTLLERGDHASMASGWTLAGVRQSGRHPAELPLAKAAIDRWTNLAVELDADPEYRQDGNLRLALTPEQTGTIEQIVSEGNAAGIPMEYLPDNAAVRAVAPALADTIVAASFCPSDGHANPHKTVAAFAAAAKRHGADLRTGVEVTALLTDGDKVQGVRTTGGDLFADTVILAAGVYTPRLLASLGIDFPLTISLVPVVQTVPMPPALAQVLGIATGGFAGRQEVSGRFRLTGTTIPWGEHGQHTAENVQPPANLVVDTIRQASALAPDLATARIGRVWGGLIDKTPDALPVIERLPEFNGLIVAAGFSGHGFCLGPITGQLLADLATGQEPSLPIESFQLRRFAAQSVTEALTLHG
jgi:sarcosine oxidase subunit beta